MARLAALQVLLATPPRRFLAAAIVGVVCYLHLQARALPRDTLRAPFGAGELVLLRPDPLLTRPPTSNDAGPRAASTLLVVIAVAGRADLLRIQVLSLRRFVRGPMRIAVYIDRGRYSTGHAFGVTPYTRGGVGWPRRIRAEAVSLGCSYVRPVATHSFSASGRHAELVDTAMRELVLRHTGPALLLDGDMFLVQPYNVDALLADMRTEHDVPPGVVLLRTNVQWFSQVGGGAARLARIGDSLAQIIPPYPQPNYMLFSNGSALPPDADRRLTFAPICESPGNCQYDAGASAGFYFAAHNDSLRMVTSTGWRRVGGAAAAPAAAPAASSDSLPVQAAMAADHALAPGWTEVFDQFLHYRGASGWSADVTEAVHGVRSGQIAASLMPWLADGRRDVLCADVRRCVMAGALRGSVFSCAIGTLTPHACRLG